MVEQICNPGSDRHARPINNLAKLAARPRSSDEDRSLVEMFELILLLRSVLSRPPYEQRSCFQHTPSR